MQRFPETPGAFYALRDSRTNECTARMGDPYAYQRVHVALVLDPTRAGTHAGRVLLGASTALLARWCRKVTIVGRRSVAVDRCLAAMRDADPFGDFLLAEELPGGADHVLHLGGNGIASSISIDGSGRTASIAPADRETPALDDHERPLGAIAAACFGVAEVFRRAVGLPPLDAVRVFDVLELQWREHPASEVALPADIGRVLLVGGGAVGSCFAYVLATCGFTGTFTVIDYDEIKVENFNRSPLCGVTTHNDLKAEAVAAALRASGSTAEPFTGDWNEFVRGGKLPDWRDSVWVPVANDRDVRLAVQRNYPPDAVHASTGVNWSVNFGRHVPGHDDCLLCRFPVKAVSQTALACATSELPAPTGTKVDAALPFASLFAGLLIAAEFARRGAAQSREDLNFALFDFFEQNFSIRTSLRAPQSTCGCAGEFAMSMAINGRTATPVSEIYEERA